MPARRRSFVLGRFCGLSGAFLQAPEGQRKCVAQCERQHKATIIVPRHVLTSLVAKAQEMGANIANVALHNAYGKLNRQGHL